MTETTPQLLPDTLSPEAISDELRPIVEELGLEQNCKELHEEGWTVIRDVADRDFTERLRTKVLELGAGTMFLAKGDIFCEAALNPKLLAMAEFSVGRGFLLSQFAATVKSEGDAGLGLHADHSWVPAPFPDHNLLLTGCWVTDEYTEASGATMIVPGSNKLRRHPSPDELASDAIAIECPPNSVAMWDGNLWHGAFDRTAPGERVVCHITYSRLMMRPVEDYAEVADELLERHGDRMAQLMGRQDMLLSKTGVDISKFPTTVNNSRR